MIKGSKHNTQTIEKIRQNCCQRPYGPRSRKVKDKISSTMKKRGTTSMENNPSWKGGRYYDSSGYIRVFAKSHPNACCDGRIVEHRLIMSNHLGRPLKKEEEVHHINGVKDDNRVENLEIVVKTMHYGKVECPFCNGKFKVK